MGKNSNLSVDTRSLCFLCYRPTKIISAGVNSRKKDNKIFSLRGVSRYMNVNFRKMMPKKYSPPPSPGGTGKFPQVVVTVCSRCSAVTEEFAKLFQYLEFTQMKINACVRNMNELMKKSDSNSRLVEKFQKKMKTTGRTEWDVVEKIRKQLAEKCSSTLKRDMPRVRIENLKNDPHPMPPPIAKGKAKITASKPGPRSRKRGLSMTKNLALTSPKVNTKTTISGKCVLPSASTPEKNVSGELFQCLHCDKTFIDTTSEDDFKIAVEQLFQDVRKITAHCGNQSESSVSYVCTCCGKPFDVKIDTYVHMVQLHHDVLSSRLTTIQKDLASSRKTAKKPLTDAFKPSQQRNKRGPYKKKSTVNSDSVTDKVVLMPTKPAKNKELKSVKSIGVGVVTKKRKSEKVKYPRICKCGVSLAARGSWNKHQKFRCKLKANTEVINVPVLTQNQILKRAKNAVGFPRTCDCGVRLTLKSSWINHVKSHCKLKVKVTTGTPAPEPKSQISRAEKRKLLFEAAANKSIRTALKKNKGRATRGLPEKKVRKKIVKEFRRICKCGSILNSQKTWDIHQRKTCKLKDMSMTSEAMDALNASVEIEEVPVDITPSGELCLSNVITSIDGSPPKIVGTSRNGGGGVIKGLHKIANFQTSFRKEKEDDAIQIIESGSYSELFSPYLPITTQMGEIDTALGKVLQNYRKFPGNISGCPFCGRGFTQLTELQNHVVESHYDEVLSQLKRLIDPTNIGQNNHSYTIDLSPGYLVKKEMEVDLSNNELNVTGSEETNDFQSYMEEDQDHLVTPKEEMARLCTNENDRNMD